jgi:hypothetical protein
MMNACRGTGTSVSRIAFYIITHNTLKYFFRDRARRRNIPLYPVHNTCCTGIRIKYGDGKRFCTPPNTADLQLGADIFSFTGVPGRDKIIVFESGAGYLKNANYEYTGDLTIHIYLF